MKPYLCLNFPHKLKGRADASDCNSTKWLVLMSLQFIRAQFSLFPLFYSDQFVQHTRKKPTEHCLITAGH